MRCGVERPHVPRIIICSLLSPTLQFCISWRKTTSTLRLGVYAGESQQFSTRSIAGFPNNQSDDATENIGSTILHLKVKAIVLILHLYT